MLGKTLVMNTYGYRITEIAPGVRPEGELDLQASNK
jgi:hypothetical protein